MPVLLTIRLKKIIYSGENIGDDLSFQFDVKGQITRAKTRISSGQYKSFDKALFQGTFTEGSVSLPISVAITEKDPIFPDIGSGSSNFNVRLQEPEPQTYSFNADIIARGGDRGKTATFTFMMEANVEKVKVELTGPDHVVLGDRFALNATITPAWNGTADISIEMGDSYSSTMRAETYWDAEGNSQNTSQYKHEFGIRLPAPATVTINNGTGSFTATQFTMEPFKIKIARQGLPNGEATYEITKERCWARVKARLEAVGRIHEGVAKSGRSKSPAADQWRRYGSDRKSYYRPRLFVQQVLEWDGVLEVKVAP